MRTPTTLVVLVLVWWAAILPAAAAADARLASPGGLYYGRIEPSSPTDDRNARCALCTGDRHNQPIIGLVLMRHLRPQNGEYVGGDILDPDTGRVWGCSLRLTDGGHQLIM